MATIRDVAERALVSVGTVSRVLNDHPSVNPAIRRAVLTAIDELQYRPSAIARTLSTGRTGTLALLLPSMRNAEVVSAVIQGAEAAAHEHGYALVIANTHGDPRIDEQYVKNLLDRRIEGLVCSPAMDVESLHCLLEQAGVPGVVLGTPGTPRSLTVAQLSFAPATEEAIDHLLALGHRRIGTITHASQSGLDASAAWGVQFIRRALDARGIETRHDFHLEAQSAEECVALVRDLASADPHPTALFVT
ncbi:MAG: LacI family DNA-binding transcriptional regulator, partial [Dehalococcoidia bacterium]